MDSDPEIEIIEKDKDSGMSSLGGSKDDTPERRDTEAKPGDGDNNLALQPAGDKLDEYADEPDETISERLWGLTEMFPETVQNVCGKITHMSVNSVSTMYKFSCNASWILFTTSIILFAPVLFETERAQMEELERSQQKQVLLGPGSALPPTGGMPAMPPMATR